MMNNEVELKNDLTYFHNLLNNQDHYTGMYITINIKNIEYTFPFIKDFLYGKNISNIKSNATYIITCSATNDFYIGSTKDIYKRIQRHRNLLNSNRHYTKKLQDSFNKSNKILFDIIIIYVNDREQAFDLEQLLLDKYINTPGCLNQLPNSRSSLGHKYSDEYKKNMSLVTKNKIFTEEHKNKISVSKTNEQNKKLCIENSLKTSKPISINGVVYKSLSEASRTLNIDISLIIYWLKSKTERFKKCYYI